MAPLIVLVVITAALLVAGAAGVVRVTQWPAALRGGLAAMFVLTGVSHFVGMRAELVDMVPPALPAPDILVSVSGVLELAGAVGLLLPQTARLAAGCLAALLIVMFPANLYAALAGMTTHAADALVPRTLLQVVFLLATLAVVIFPGRGTALVRTAPQRVLSRRGDGRPRLLVAAADARHFGDPAQDLGMTAASASLVAVPEESRRCSASVRSPDCS
ncbi:MAG: DoxX family membrane protein [Nocardioides sp.]|nr:DoxX family membrane protein [Nocardioides sp.]